jgi:hypothetical protein
LVSEADKGILPRCRCAFERKRNQSRRNGHQKGADVMKKRKTKRWWSCPKCTNAPREWAKYLMRALDQVACGQLPPCSICQGERQLIVRLNYQKGIQIRDEIVEKAFVHRDYWGPEGARVEFRPFLVILKSDKGRRKIWLPYCHVQNGKTAYGQWAPSMDVNLFFGLVSDAQRFLQQEKSAACTMALVT